MTKIQWVENDKGEQGKTWNPILGCSKVSAGCQNCYAISQVHRMAGNPNEKVRAANQGLTERRGGRTEWTGEVRFLPERLQIPLKTKKPTTWFVNSLSDLFHEAVEDEWIEQIYGVMAITPWHTYQILTKRPERMLAQLRSIKNRVRLAAVDLARKYGIDCTDIESCQWDWPLPNVHLGVSVENQKAADERIPLLLQPPAAVRFLSCEPLLGAVDLRSIKAQYQLINALTGDWQNCGGGAGGAVAGGRDTKIDWVIVGGESGKNARPCHIEHIRSIVKQCQSANVPVFVKQLGSVWASENSSYKDLKGENIDFFPKDLQVRQMPVGVSNA